MRESEQRIMREQNEFERKEWEEKLKRIRRCARMNPDLSAETMAKRFGVSSQTILKAIGAVK